MSAKYTQALLVFAIGLFALLTVLTAWSRWEIGVPPGDYRCFDAAAERFLAGEPFYVHEHDHFDSPPYFVWLTLPAHALGLAGGHGLAIVSGLGLTALALWMVRRSIVPTPSSNAVLIAALYPPIWLSASIAQWGGAFFAAFPGVLFFASRKRALEAGLVASVFFAKPTLGLFVLPLVLVTLGRRAWIGVAIGAGVWALLALPLGASIWPAWLDQLSWASEAHAIAEHRWQHFTLLGTLRALAGVAGFDLTIARAIWALIALPLGALTFAIAVRSMRRGDVTRAFSVVAIATIALNVYIRYYDSLAILVPALALAGRSNRPRATGIVALTYLLLASVDSAYFQAGVPVPLEGGLLTAWLGLELYEAWRDGQTGVKEGPRAEQVSRSIPNVP